MKNNENATSNMLPSSCERKKNILFSYDVHVPYNSEDRSELYGRKYDQGKVTYNDIYFQQKSLWPIFFPFSSRKLSTEIDRTGADLILISVTGDKKRVSISVTNIYCWLFLLFIIDLHVFLYTDSEQSSPRAQRDTNEVGSTVKNMIKEK